MMNPRRLQAAHLVLILATFVSAAASAPTTPPAQATPAPAATDLAPPPTGDPSALKR